MRRDPLRAFWRHYRNRRSRTTTRVVYGAYLGALLAAIYGIPAVWSLASAAHQPHLVALATAPRVESALGSLLGLVLVAAFAAGTSRGPVVMRAFLIHALTTSPVAREGAFGRVVARAVVAVAGVFAAVAGLLFGVLASVGVVGVLGLVAGVTSACLFGVLVAIAWLAGQAARGHLVWLVPATLLLAVVGAATVQGPPLMPWEWEAATWPDGSGSSAVVPVALLAAAAAAAVAWVPALLRSMSGPDLVAQARSWEGATIAASTGDLTAAMGGLRAAPRVGRRWRVVRQAPFLPAVTYADLVGSLRTPTRALLGCAALGAGGWGLSASIAAAGPVAVGSGIVAGLLVFAGLGAFCDGLRHAVLAVSTPRLFGMPDVASVLARTGAPMLAGSVSVAVGALLGAAARGVDPWRAVALGVLLVATVATVRGSASAKGVLPLSLTMPIITPLGDLSAVGVALWQADAVLISGLLGASLPVLADGSMPAAAISVAAVGFTVAQWRARLTAL